MPSKRALAIRHVAFEDLGTFEPVLAEFGYSVSYCDIGKTQLDGRQLAAADLVVILGGPIGCYETTQYPFLNNEVEAIRVRLESGAPTLGICLGAQLIANALGAAVYPGPVKEIGWAPVVLTDHGLVSVARHLGQDGQVLHWHGDTFDLPPGARLLASTRDVRNQAYAIGTSVLAFQFHPEIRTEDHEQWLIGHAHELAANKIDIPALRADTKRNGPDLERRARSMLSEWLGNLPPS
ncbi:glutamine amidotransferase [Bradyrhizobium sp. sBnM-33]|uniref:glutamine amidotransferase n=1 Tax=Bradyrhizobium sp. sBnM-33 TaxID=2831780 RepID=UPI001BCCF0A5|nr:glutamine amidotransferase [Bradyrhizobium sp. sBnM-33]WOH50097.1 glutamine amidotransferase [Bradyrhizobium sp. sBnM-33]